MTVIPDSEWEAWQRSFGGIYHLPEHGHFTIGLNFFHGPDASKTHAEMWESAIDLLGRGDEWAAHREAVEAAVGAGSRPHYPMWIVEDEDWDQYIQPRHPIPGRMATRLNERFAEIEEFIIERCSHMVINFSGMLWLFANDLDALHFRLRFYGEMKPWWWPPNGGWV